ncbi:hypothetical protein [Actinomyces sp. MRS3W]|uniref:hypothetical protein n=1 Tax=Actinomyces sp. MRS3W TaxID=2800796 RepID=UPI0028FD9ACF|nr:hypothetical protein [Actinomyces sp. MRS3W]MDU0347433.1 hypothetical protein [Actinomyces sp. MRS3W]
MADKETLTELKDFVDERNRSAGLVDPYACTITEGLYAWVNASDTWVGPLADDESANTKTEIDALIAVFAGLSEDLESAIATAESSEDAD